MLLIRKRSQTSASPPTIRGLVLFRCGQCLPHLLLSPQGILSRGPESTVIGIFLNELILNNNRLSAIFDPVCMQYTTWQRRKSVIHLSDDVGGPLEPLLAFR